MIHRDGRDEMTETVRSFAHALYHQTGDLPSARRPPCQICLGTWTGYGAYTETEPDMYIYDPSGD